MRDYADITVLLDRSGSMQHIKDAMESGFDEFLTEHKKTPSTRLTLIQFDNHNNQEVVYTARAISEAPRLSIDPRGMTPLLDAFCLAIDGTGARLAAMPEHTRPNKVLFVVITDGAENSSYRFRRADVKERVTRQHDNYKWQFVYLGANQDAIAEAEAMGINFLNAVSYTADAARSRGAMRSMAVKSANYTISGDAGALNWNASEREALLSEEDKKKFKPGRLPK